MGHPNLPMIRASARASSARPSWDKADAVARRRMTESDFTIRFKGAAMPPASEVDAEIASLSN